MFRYRDSYITVDYVSTQDNALYPAFFIDQENQYTTVLITYLCLDVEI